jgi:hypothetical protein
LDVPFGQGGQQLQTFICHNGLNQQWTFDNDAHTWKSGTGICMDVADASTKDRAVVQTHTCNGQPNQIFNMVATGFDSELCRGAL